MFGKNLVKHFYCFEYNNIFYTFDTHYFVVVIMNRKQQEILHEIAEDRDINRTLEDLNYQKVLYCIKNGLFLSVIKENKYIEEKKVASISFTPTHRCNLRCRYCFANHGNNFNGVKRDLEKEVIMASFDFFYNKIFKPYKKIRIDLVGGGENFLNVNAIREILHQASKRDKEYSLWICTNGTIYNDEISKLLIDRKLSLGVSLDGDQKINDINRIDINGNSVYNKVIKNISLIRNEIGNRNAHLKDIWGLVVITPTTESLVDIIKHHKKIGFSSVQMKIERRKEEYTRSDIEVICNLYKELTDFFIQLINQEDISYLKLILNDNDYYGKIQKRLLLNKRYIHRCSAGKSKFAVDAEGNIYPCDSFVGDKKFVLGNVFKMSTEVINSEFNTLNVNIRIPCKNCWAKELCGGDCMHSAYLQNNTIFGASKAFCKIQKSIIKYNIVLFNELSQKQSLLNELTKFLKIRERLM